MNNLQEKEYSLLKYFIEICEKLNLNYYLLCGSALGAVKYQGFIPWDDDIDVGLPREDYIVFCEKAQDLLPKDIFLQTYLTDSNYPCIFAKIRDSNTTYIEKSSAKISMNHGVYIDVFPLDGYPEDIKQQQKIERKKLFFKLQLLSAYESDCSFKIKVLKKIFRLFGIHKRTKKILVKYENLISSYSTETSKIWCNHGNWQGKLEYAPQEQYGSGITMSFEGLEVRIPQKYDEYLTQKYGDWRAELPKEQQVGHHFYEKLDLKNSYRMYIKE